MVQHSYCIKWNGGSIHVSGFQTAKDARDAARGLAADMGWTPRRWWQFWRIFEHEEAIAL